MTKHTTRDEIWHVTLQTVAAAREGNAAGYSGDRITVDEVIGRLSADPSRRTVRDCLATMEEHGYLSSRYRQGEYEPPQDPAEVVAARSD